jgi:hypothetical protein
MKKILFSMFYSILVGEEPDLVFLKKDGMQNQFKMRWITPSCAKDLTISEGTRATLLFNFHSRVSILFHALSLRPRNMKWTNSFAQVAVSNLNNLYMISNKKKDYQLKDKK